MTDFILQALVFIGSAVILVPIFQRLRLGSVLGYLMAGILVGPQGLKLIQDSESVIRFAELGVVLLLFLIGLEIQPIKLWSMRRHLLGLGGVQILFSSALFTAIGCTLGLPPVSAGVIGFAMSLSSTAFALQTLTERNQFNTEFGRSSFSILLMQDLAAIPALALIPLLDSSSHHSAITVKDVLTVVAMIVFLFVASRYLIRPAFRIIASTRTREIFTAATLFIVLGVAALMQQVGLSAALGTFLAGVLLADSEYRHELEADLEPFKSLLMGLFFIGVGMEVSLDVIAHQPFLVFGLAFGYLVSKAVVIYCAGRIFRMSHENSKLMALTIAQGGEFAFVIFGIAGQSALAPSETLVLLTSVITLSMAIGPVMSLVSEWISRKREVIVKPEYDQIDGEAPEVIIAGYGRFGQIFGRILNAQGIRIVAIDHDSEQIDLVRRFGTKVYYGDVTRQDLLEAAGAAKAKYLVLAVDSVEVSLEVARLVVKEYPNLKIFARARNRGHAFDLMDVGVRSIKRETFDSSVYFVRDLLIDRGLDRSKAQELVDRFKRHDEIMLVEQFKVRQDDKAFVSISKQATAQLAQVLSEDLSQTYIDAPKSGE